MHGVSDPDNVLNCTLERQHQLQQLLQPYGIEIQSVADDSPIPGSFFGEREAGLVGNQMLLRHDTPVHSALHEAGHYICMDAHRRLALDTDAQGDYEEENAVCYLQILLSDFLPDVGRDRMMQDMDSWGYTFRLGSAKAWFEQDADEVLDWLKAHQIIDPHGHPTWQLRH